jgi:hypothetical protein
MQPAIDHKPFPMEFRRTSNAVPAHSARVLSSEESSVLQELNEYDLWRTRHMSLPIQPALKPSVRFQDDSTLNHANACTDIVPFPTFSESRSLVHRNAQLCEGFV